jgi:cation transport ATPase
MAINKTPRIIITLEEAHLAKKEAKEVVNYMRNKLKLKVGMITGDNKHTAVKVARYLDIDLENITYRAYPNDKKNKVAGF